MSKTMKGCPFCGASEQWINYHSGRILMYPPSQAFWCQVCGGALIDTDSSHCYNDLLKAWNRREGKKREK